MNADSLSTDRSISPEVISQVNKLMMSGFEIAASQLSPSAKLGEDLGLDSLDAVDMLVYIEETLGVKVEGERLANVRTLSDVYQLAEDALKISPSHAVVMKSERELVAEI
jgi:acyl carrier protein